MTIMAPTEPNILYGTPQCVDTMLSTHTHDLTSQRSFMRQKSEELRVGDNLSVVTQPVGYGV